jgi:hypothetical protein
MSRTGPGGTRSASIISRAATWPTSQACQAPHIRRNIQPIEPSRGIRIGQLFLSVAFAALGIWALAQADYVTGAIYLVFGVTWLVIAGRGLQRARSRS